MWIVRFRPRQQWRVLVEWGRRGSSSTSRLVHLRHGREFKQFRFHAYRWPDFTTTGWTPAKNAYWGLRDRYSEQG